MHEIVRSTVKSIGIALLIPVFLVVAVHAQQQEAHGYGLLIDNTLSTMQALPEEISFAQEVVTQAGKESYLSIFTFATDPNSKYAKLSADVTCVTDRDSIRTRLSEIFAVTGQTALVDGIRQAAERIADKPPTGCPAYRNKQLILITDGEDRASVTKPAELFSYLKSSGVKVLVIGIVTGLSDERGFMPKSARQSAKDFLDRLTKETGGRVVYPKKNQPVTEVVKILLDEGSK